MPLALELAGGRGNHPSDVHNLFTTERVAIPPEVCELQARVEVEFTHKATLESTTKLFLIPLRREEGFELAPTVVPKE